LADEVEEIVLWVLRTRYLARQRRSVAVICREIDQECKVQGLRSPLRSSVQRRIGRPGQVKAAAARDFWRPSSPAHPCDWWKSVDLANDIHSEDGWFPTGYACSR
jgi:hypothetical protein